MILLLIFLLIIPFFVGQPVRKIIDHGGRGVADTYICGVMIMLVLSGVVHFFVMFTNRTFSEYLGIYPITVAVFAFAGLLVTFPDVKRNNAEYSIKARLIAFVKSWFKGKELIAFCVLTLIVTALCVFRIFTEMPVHAGDFTLETIRTTLQTDSIYQYNSFTGKLLEEGMPIRQQILTMPFFLAFLSEFSGVSIAVIIYNVMPCFGLLLSIIVISRYAATLFVKKKEIQLVFVSVAIFMILVGDYLHMAPATLLLHQGFTGNALCVGVIIPFAVYACITKRWLMACLCAVTELFLIWTTYGLGYCVLVIFAFGLIGLVGNLTKK